MTFEFGLHACKILSGYVKEFAGVIHEKPILSKYILRCQAFA